MSVYDSELVTRIQTTKKDLVAFWAPRDIQLRKDRAMVALTETAVPKGFVKVVLNEPKVTYDTSTSILSSFIPVYRLPLSVQSTADKTKMSKAERLLIGIFRELDRKQQDLGQDSFYRELAYNICSGWYCVFPHIIKENGRPEFYATLYDPLTVYPEWGSRGLVKLVRTYWTTKRVADLMLAENNWSVDLTSDAEMVEIINYWEKRVDKEGNGKVTNTVLVAGKIAKNETEEDYPNIPIIVGTVAGTPYRPISNTDTNWISSRGESVIAANRSTYEHLNKWVSLVMQVVQDVAYPNILDYTESGDPAISGTDLGSGKIIHRKLGETVDTLKIAGVPGELNQVLSILSGSAQRGGLPYVIYGGLPFELSGYALSQLYSALRYKLNPYMTAMQSVLSRMCVEYLREFRKGKYSIELLTEKPERVGKGEAFVEEFNHKDIPPTTYVDVSIPLTLPTDKNQQILMARQAMQEPALMSRPTLWDEYLGIQDGELEYSRIIDDSVLNLPVMKTIAVIERLKERAAGQRESGNSQGAAILEKYAQMMEMSVIQQLQTDGSGGQSAPSGDMTGQGVPTSMAPPEMTGQPTTDMMRQQLGIPPTGAGGKPARAGGAPSSGTGGK